MEAYGVVYRPQPSVAGAGIDDRRSRLAVAVGGRTNGAGNLRIPRPRGRTAVVVRRCGFSDEGSLKYYYNNSPPRCRGGGGGVVEEEVNKKAMKKRLKLLKGLLSMDHLDNNSNTQGLLDQIKGNMISDATEVLLTQLGQQLKAEEKELKRKKKEAKAIKKQENKKKKKKKMMLLQCQEQSSSSSSSSSSESDCGEVVDMSRLKNQVLAPPPPPPPAVINELLPEQQQNSPVSPAIASQSQLSAGHGLVEDLSSRVNVAIVQEQPLLVSSLVENKKKIEVCMGGKCKKSGAALLIEEFNKVLGGASSTVAVGCKCMGKCKSAPNVRVVLNDDNSSTTQTPPATTKSLCIGVGIDDVSTIVSNFLLQNHNTVDDGFVAAAAM